MSVQKSSHGPFSGCMLSLGKAVSRCNSAPACGCIHFYCNTLVDAVSTHDSRHYALRLIYRNPLEITQSCRSIVGGAAVAYVSICIYIYICTYLVRAASGSLRFLHM